MMMMMILRLNAPYSISTGGLTNPAGGAYSAPPESHLHLKGPTYKGRAEEGRGEMGKRRWKENTCKGGGKGTKKDRNGEKWKGKGKGSIEFLQLFNPNLTTGPPSTHFFLTTPMHSLHCSYRLSLASRLSAFYNIGTGMQLIGTSD